jgi:tRNA(fMet)-specific endonuclease VapC
MKYYALDTNIVSYYLGKNTQIMDKVDAVLTANDSIVIPPIVYYEIIRGLIHIKAVAKLKIFENLCFNGIGIMDKDLFDIAVSLYNNLRGKGYTIGDNDILIAAYCLKHNLILITNNTKHFENIDGLVAENWAKG